MTIELDKSQEVPNEYRLPGGNTLAHEDGSVVMRDSDGYLLGMGYDNQSVIRAVYDVYQGREIASHLEEYVIFEDKGGENSYE